jgi:hypothetical protein
MVNKIMRRLIDGDRKWGTLDFSPAGRTTWQSVHLTVYPPGVTPVERRSLRFAHLWPVAGSILCLVVMIMLSDVLTPIWSLIVAVSVYIAGFLLGSHLTRPLKGRIRTLNVSTVYLADSLTKLGDCALMNTVRARFDALDAFDGSGSLSPVAYEAEWARIYDLLPPQVRVETRARSSHRA